MSHSSRVPQLVLVAAVVLERCEQISAASEKRGRLYFEVDMSELELVTVQEPHN
jgi:hypothetical protein